MTHRGCFSPIIFCVSKRRNRKKYLKNKSAEIQSDLHLSGCSEKQQNESSRGKDVMLAGTPALACRL